MATEIVGRKMDHFVSIGVKQNSIDLSVCLCTLDLIVRVSGVSHMVIKTISNTLMISVLVNGYYKTTEI